jgi:hypothetical protein
MIPARLKLQRHLCVLQAASGGHPMPGGDAAADRPDHPL